MEGAGEYSPAFSFLTSHVYTAELPRFGGFPYDEETGTVDYSKNDLDERVSQEIVAILEMRGLYFKRQRRAGMGCIAEFHADGSTTGRWGR